MQLFYYNLKETQLPFIISKHPLKAVLRFKTKCHKFITFNFHLLLKDKVTLLQVECGDLRL